MLNFSNNNVQHEPKKIKQWTGKLEDILTYDKFFEALRKCNDDVSYKMSVQKYDINCIGEIVKAIKYISDGNIPKVRKISPILIYERGKQRVITPIEIHDRMIQKVLCDNALIPALYPHLIYDNGASMQGKGTQFSRNRVHKFLEDAKRKWGFQNVYVLIYDFKSFFDSIPHQLCYDILDKYIEDKRIVNLTIGIIESYDLYKIQKIKDKKEREQAEKDLFAHKGKGLCLGSQISQIMAMAVLNDFDHYIKDVKRMKFSLRHMDDGIIFFNNKQKLVELKNELQQYANHLGMQLSPNKTYIAKVTDGFTFLKIKYHYDEKGKTVKKLVHSNITRERTKLKKFKDKVQSGEMSLDDVYNSMQSWNEHSKIANSFKTSKSMFKIYDDLYEGHRMTRKYYNNHPEIKRKRKVTRL